MGRNVAFCAVCWKVIESKHRHDYVTCGCPNDAMLDGGQERYVRMGAVRPEYLVPMKAIEIDKYEALAGDYDKKNYLVQLFEASRIDANSYGNQITAMRAGNYGESAKADNTKSDGKKYTIIYEEFSVGPSTDVSKNPHDVKMKRLDLSKKADRHWYAYACASVDINILFNFAGWPKERSHG